MAGIQTSKITTAASDDLTIQPATGGETLVKSVDSTNPGMTPLATGSEGELQRLNLSSLQSLSEANLEDNDLIMVQNMTDGNLYATELQELAQYTGSDSGGSTGSGGTAGSVTGTGWTDANTNTTWELQPRKIRTVQYGVTEGVTYSSPINGRWGPNEGTVNLFDAHFSLDNFNTIIQGHQNLTHRGGAENPSGRADAGGNGQFVNVNISGTYNANIAYEVNNGTNTPTVESKKTHLRIRIGCLTAWNGRFYADSGMSKGGPDGGYITFEIKTYSGTNPSDPAVLITAISSLIELANPTSGGSNYPHKEFNVLTNGLVPETSLTQGAQDRLQLIRNKGGAVTYT